MSSFFRSASEVSDSNDTSTSGYESSGHISSAPSKTGKPGVPSQGHDLALQSSGPSIASAHHQHVLVHALLEDKCLNDVWHELNQTFRGRYSRDHPIVKARAAERYRALTGQLAAHGLVAAGLEGDNFHHIRQTARDGLSLLSHQLDILDLSDDGPPGSAQTQSLTRQPLRRLHAADTTPDGFVQDSIRALPTPEGRTLGLTSQLLPSHPLLDSTRYVRDFEEVCMVGKGGYGRVFHVNHRLDGRSYAVKKIPLGPSVLQRVQKRGEGELNNILAELRTMAKMEHPNLVRYFGGWVEWAKPDEGNALQSTSEPRLVTAGSTSATDSLPASSSPAQLPAYDLETSAGASARNAILFEDSVSRQCPSDSTAPLSVADGNALQQTHTRSTTATVADEEIEIVPRDEPTAPGSVSTTDAEPFVISGPSLTLHIQMSLYPLTLAQYLSSTAVFIDESQLTLQHCFHLQSSVDLLLAIIDGVEYLHAHGIVHRDLKPANIFLSPKLCIKALIPLGSVNPLSCSSCISASNESSPPCSTEQTLRLGVCVGDFGLVSTLASRATAQPSSSETTSAKGVGTALYRPTHSSRDTHPSQDIYALGIIFFELLNRFDTRMERHDVLMSLREKGTFLQSFTKEAELQEARSLIEDMLMVPRRDDVTLADIKLRLKALVMH